MKYEGYTLRYLLASLIKIVVVSVAMGAGSLWLDDPDGSRWRGPGLPAQLFALLAAMAGAVFFYFAAISFMGITEMNYLVVRLRSRLNI